MTDTEIVDFIAKYSISIHYDGEEYNVRFIDDNGDLFSLVSKDFRACIEKASKRIAANSRQGDLNEELF